MAACKYWDCGWCYAPNYLKTNAINSTCVDPSKCPISLLSKLVQYETPMTEIEKVKAEIKVLEKKLSFLEELEKTKSPMEEAYNEWYGEYPPTSPDADKRDIARWHGFQAGYNAAYREPKDNEWKNVALEFGKKLPVILPYSYAELSPNSWYRWVVFTYDKYMEERDKECGYTPNQKAQEPEEQVSFVPKEIKELVKEGVKWCEEHPDTDPLDWLKPQTPEQVADGLKEAFREAIKQGIIPEIKEPTNELIDKLTKNPPEFLKFELGKTLTDIIYRWWEDVFTTHSDWDMETSIEDLVDQIQLWLPKEQSAAGSQSIGVEELVQGFNDCLKKIKRKLR